MSARTRWIAAICGLLAINVAASIALAIAANNGGTRIVPGYETKASP